MVFVYEIDVVAKVPQLLPMYPVGHEQVPPLQVPPFIQVILEHGSELLFVHEPIITVVNKIAVITAVRKTVFVCVFFIVVDFEHWLKKTGVTNIPLLLKGYNTLLNTKDIATPFMWHIISITCIEPAIVVV